MRRRTSSAAGEGPIESFDFDSALSALWTQATADSRRARCRHGATSHRQLLGRARAAGCHASAVAHFDSTAMRSRMLILQMPWPATRRQRDVSSELGAPVMQVAPELLRADALAVRDHRLHAGEVAGVRGR
jgi:hypothetical protein